VRTSGASQLVNVELGGRVVRVPRARLGLARARGRDIVKVVRRDRPRRARGARETRRRPDAPDEVGHEAEEDGEGRVSRLAGGPFKERESRERGERGKREGGEREREEQEERVSSPSPARLVRRSKALASFAIEKFCEVKSGASARELGERRRSRRRSRQERGEGARASRRACTPRSALGRPKKTIQDAKN